MINKKLFLIFLLIFAIIISISLGSVKIPLNNIYEIFFNKLSSSELRTDLLRHEIIIFQFRFPRIILAGLTGVCLSLVGATYQGIFKNPLADPYVLGVSSGAALGATISIILLKNIHSLGFTSFFAFLFAILTVFSTYFLSKTKSKIKTINLLLAGIALSYFLSSLISFLMILNHEQIDTVFFWIMGSFSNSNWTQVAILFPITFCYFIVMKFYSRDFNIILLEEEQIYNSGINYELFKKVLFFITSFIVAINVSMVGIIGFVGFIVPHAARMLFGQNYKNIIAVSALLGASIMILADLVSRILISPGEIPVGITTSLIGVPYFIFLLYKNKKVDIL